MVVWGWGEVGRSCVREWSGRLCNRGMRPGPGETVLDKTSSHSLIELFGTESFDRDLNAVKITFYYQSSS